jgi:phosphatidylglycerophosphate synthase
VVTRAIIVGADSDADRDVIGGLSVLMRQRLSLQDAGVCQLITIDAADRDLPSDASAIVVTPGTIWHPAVVKRLAKTSVAPHEIVAVGNRDAAVYACGRDRIASAVATLIAGGSIPLDAPPAAPAPPEFVVRSRSDAERRQATALLLRSLEKPSDGLASRYLHRPISRQVTRLLLPWRVSPNAMTLAAALFGVAGVIVAARGGYWRVLAGAVLFETQNVLDGCDGEIARLKYLRSRGGEWLDQIVDDVLNVAFLGAVGAALARGGAAWARPLALIAFVAQAVHVVGLYAGLLVRGGGRGSVARLRWWVGSGEGRSLAGDLTRRDLLSFAYVVAALLNVVVVTFVWHVVLTIGSAVVTTVQWIVWGGPAVQTDGDGVVERAGSAAA